MGPASGDAFDNLSTYCTNLQKSAAELGTTLLLAHPVNCRWGIVRAGTLCNVRFFNTYMCNVKYSRVIYVNIMMYVQHFERVNVRYVRISTIL